MVIFEPRIRFSDAVVRQQAHHRHKGLTLARAALADHAQAFARSDAQTDPAHGGDDPVGGGEIDLEVVDGQDGLSGQEMDSPELAGGL